MWGKCAFVHSDKEAPNKKSKKDQLCITQDVEVPEQPVGLTDARRSKRSLRAHLELKCTKTGEIFINIGEQLGPSLGVIRDGPKHHRNANAPTFENRDPTNTLWAEGDARKADARPRSCSKFAEPTWRTKLHSLIQS